MYGVPKNLPLQRFVGDSICQIAFGLHEIQFHFNRAGTISVEGEWQIYDSSGKIVDESIDENALPSSRLDYKFHVILEGEVTKFELNVPDSFTLIFSSGYRLKIFNHENYTVSIHPGNWIF